jgi:hypothetical protein
MSFSTYSSTVALVLVGLVAQGKFAPKLPTAPETFRAIVDAKAATGGAAGYLDIKLDKYTADADHDVMVAALKSGQPALVAALRKAPSIGTLTLGKQSVAIRWAREKRTGPNGRTITLVGEKPIYYLGGGAPDAKPREGFELSVVQFNMDDAGVGQGKMAAAAKVKVGGDTGVEIEDYADKPIMLTTIHRDYKSK